MRAVVRQVAGKRSGGELELAPLNAISLRDEAYALLKDAIANADIYSRRWRLRL